VILSTPRWTEWRLACELHAALTQTNLPTPPREIGADIGASDAAGPTDEPIFSI
jgi:hypothetical protein